LNGHFKVAKFIEELEKEKTGDKKEEKIFEKSVYETENNSPGDIEKKLRDEKYESSKKEG
jgi:hypothetical protein